MKTTIRLASLFFTISCGASGKFKANLNTSTLKIEGSFPRSIGPNTPFYITGQNLTQLEALYINGIPVTVEDKTATKLSLRAPALTGFNGPVDLRDKYSTLVSGIIYSASQNGNIPFFEGSPELFCNASKYINGSGRLTSGTKNCGSNLSNDSTTCVDTDLDTVPDSVSVLRCDGTKAFGRLSTKLCDSNGEVDCLTTVSFRAADLTNLEPTNVRSGMSIAGVAGNLIETPADCASNGATSCVATATYQAADLTNLTPANIRLGVDIGGVIGNVTPTPPDCAANGVVGCVTTTTYQSGDLTNLSAGNIRSGISIAGTGGTYPSAATPLIGASGVVNDLTFATFEARISSAANFEWFDSEGNRYSETGDADLTAANIRDGVFIFSEEGTYDNAGQPACSSDAETNCITDASFPAADATVLLAANIRQGVTIGGVAGSLTPPATLRMFVSSSSHNGNLGGVAGADTICQNLADTATLGGTWMALLSDGATHARDRLNTDAYIYNLNGKLLFDRNQIWSGDTNFFAVQYDENVGSVNAEVWTGTRPNGNRYGDHCSSWTVGTGFPNTGTAGGSNDDVFNIWIDGPTGQCDELKRIYCLEQ